MGISGMQGTSAFIEYVGERKIKKYSCKNCKNYFDGVCMVKKVAIEYGDGYGKICKEFNPINTTVVRKISNKKSTNISLRNNSNNIMETVHSVELKGKNIKTNKNVVTLGCKIEIQEVKLSKENFEIEVCEGKIKNEFANILLNHGIGYEFEYEGIVYKIVSISHK